MLFGALATLAWTKHNEVLCSQGFSDTGCVIEGYTHIKGKLYHMGMDAPAYVLVKYDKLQQKAWLQFDGMMHRPVHTIQNR